MIARAISRAEAEASLLTAQAEILALGVRRLALFGSVQRDAARADSDVDVLVEFLPGKKSYDHFLALGDLLERVLGRPVELVTAESLSPFLKPYILAEARDVVRAA
jgi:predicted nucleotidyltransferase